MKVYLDNSATTRCFDEVAQLMMQVMCRDSDLIIGMHNGYQNRFFTDCFLQILQADPALSIHRQIGHAKSLILQIPHCLYHCRMFYLCRDQMPSHAVIGHRGAYYGDIIGFRSS